MRESRLADRVMYDGLYTFVLRILNVACAAGLGILTARILGPAGKGLYALPAVEAGLVASAFSGLNSGTSYFLLNRKAGRALLTPAFVTATMFIAAGAAVIAVMALVSGQRWTLVPAVLSLPSVAGLNMAMGYAVGIKKVRYASTAQVAVTVLTLLLIAAGFVVFSRTPGVAIAMWLIANGVIAVIAVTAVIVHSRRLPSTERVSITEYAKFGVKIGVVNLIALLNYRADLYIVAVMASPAILGMYTVGVSAAESLLVPTQVAALVTSPYIGGLDVQAAGQLAARCVRNNLLLALVVCGALFVLARPVVQLLYGSAFLPVVPALHALLIGVVALSLGSPISSFFTLKLGRPEVALWLASASAAICIGLSILLVPKVGMLGAAIGSTAGYVVGQTAAIFYFSRCSAIGIGTILVPTLADFSVYAGFAGRLYRDGMRLLHAPASTR